MIRPETILGWTLLEYQAAPDDHKVERAWMVLQCLGDGYYLLATYDWVIGTYNKRQIMHLSGIKKFELVENFSFLDALT